MKIVVFSFLLFFTQKIVGQTPQEISQNIAKFIDATVQVPFMAKVADVKGAVRIRITLNDSNQPEKLEVVQSLRKDCDEEALRVVKLIRVKNIQDLIQGKKRITFEVPFLTDRKIYYENGIVTEYFDANKVQRLTNEGYTYLRKFPVDSTSGNILGNSKYFEFKKSKEKKEGIGKIEIDKTYKYIPEFSENIADTLVLISTVENNDLGYPSYGYTRFDNGNLAFKNIGNDVNLKFFSDGRIKSITEVLYNGTNNVQNITNWYANGQIAVEKTIDYNSNGEFEKISTAYDTTGNLLVTKGNGFYTYQEFYENKTLINSGNIEEGLKVGKWVGKFTDGTPFYEEEYQKGKLLNGFAFYNNEKIEYNKLNKQAQMKGGMKAFQNHLLTNLRYPMEAQRSRITGKVFLSFDVCTDGSLCDFKILKGVEKNLNEEALRVVKLMSGQWEPAIFRGKPVKNKFNLPISFMLE
jgi:TonB family protein